MASKKAPGADFAKAVSKVRKANKAYDKYKKKGSKDQRLVANALYKEVLPMLTKLFTSTTTAAAVKQKLKSLIEDAQARTSQMQSEIEAENPNIRKAREQAAIADQRIKQAMKDEKMAAEARIRNLKDDIDEIIGCGDLPAVIKLYKKICGSEAQRQELERYAGMKQRINALEEYKETLEKSQCDKTRQDEDARKQYAAARREAFERHFEMEVAADKAAADSERPSSKRGAEHLHSTPPASPQTSDDERDTPARAPHNNTAASIIQGISARSPVADPRSKFIVPPAKCTGSRDTAAFASGHSMQFNASATQLSSSRPCTDYDDVPPKQKPISSKLDESSLIQLKTVEAGVPRGNRPLRLCTLELPSLSFAEHSVQPAPRVDASDLLQKMTARLNTVNDHKLLTEIEKQSQRTIEALEAVKSAAKKLSPTEGEAVSELHGGLGPRAYLEAACLAPYLVALVREVGVHRPHNAANYMAHRMGEMSAHDALGADSKRHATSSGQIGRLGVLDTAPTLAQAISCVSKERPLDPIDSLVKILAA